MPILDFERFREIDVNGYLEVLPDVVLQPGDYHLQPGSPALDQGLAESAPTTDFDGGGRPCGNGMDIGAYENGDCAPSSERFVRGDANQDGAMNISDPIALLNYLFAGEANISCLDAGDVDDDREVTITDGVYCLNFLFGNGKSPVEPFERCGIDPTIDDLSCDRIASCE
jgi:hypothetical protein